MQIGELQATAFKDDELGKVEENTGDAHYLQVPPRALDKKGDGLLGQIPPKSAARSGSESVCTQLRSFFHTKQLERQSQLQGEGLNAETNSLRKRLGPARQFEPEYRRQNALNKFNPDTCEFNILRSQESKICRIKDSVSIFYKRIETLPDPDDPHYNELSKKYFGYKSSLIRSKIDGQVMEMYQPKLIEKGNRNLKMKEERLRVPKSLEEFQEMKREEHRLK